MRSGLLLLLTVQLHVWRENRVIRGGETRCKVLEGELEMQAQEFLG